MTTTHSWDDTIFAIATPQGDGSQSVLRISGPKSLALVTVWTQSLPKSFGRQSKCWAGTCELTIDSIASPLLVEACVWNTGISPTGQPLVEISLPTCKPIADAVMADLARRGARLAHRGEFSLRRFLAGKSDLLRTEGVLELIEADSTERIAAALDRLSGNLSREVTAVRDELLIVLADLEAGLDFVDEDILFLTDDQAEIRIEELARAVVSLLQRFSQQQLMRQMPHVVLVGAPNAGKSSLFNALLTRNRAIVSPVAGTTRDSVSAPLRINAHDILLVDTAGEGDTDDPLADLVDVQRARTHAGADIRLVCVPAVTDAEASAAIMRAEEESAFDVPQIVVRTKSDLLPGFEPEPGAIAISLHAGDVGLLLDRLRSAISTALEQRRFQDQRRANYAANVRVANSLRETNRALTDAMKTLTNKSGHELVAVSLREAIAHLGEITGAVYTDDLLDKVFSRFCIGK